MYYLFTNERDILTVNSAAGCMYSGSMSRNDSPVKDSEIEGASTIIMVRIPIMAARVWLIVLSLMVLAPTGLAQLTIINTPSTDTLEPRAFYIEVDAIGKPVSYRKGGFQSYGYRTVYGIDRKTEVGVSFFYTNNGVSTPLEMQFSAKRKLFQSERWGVSVATGVTAYVPLNTAAGGRTLFFVYGNASKTIRQMNGLRLTAGAYRIFNAEQNFGVRSGAMLGLEQPLNERVSFVSDWLSGANRYGYLSAGFSFAIPRRQTATVAYNWGNTGRGNNFLTGFYTITF